MLTMDQSLLDLYKEGAITVDTALDYASNPDQLRRRLGLSTGGNLRMA